MRATENEKRDWSVIVLILLFGLLALLLAGRWALRFAPHWELDVNVESRIDPNSDFLTRKPEGFIEPVDPAILTNAAWINDFLTPGASFSTLTQLPKTASTSITAPTVSTSATAQTAPSATSTAFATNTVSVLASPTNTLIYFPPPATSTPKPKPVSTFTSIIASPTPTASATPSPTGTMSQTFTVTSTFTATATSTPTATSIFTNTPTDTATATSIPTFTNTPPNTPTPTTPPFCTTTIVITGTSGSYAKPGGSTCFEYADTFTNGGVFQITSTSVNGTVDGSSCPGISISNGSTINYGVAQSGGLMMFRITGTAGTVDINISDWTTYPTCP